MSRAKPIPNSRIRRATNAATTSSQRKTWFIAVARRAFALIDPQQMRGTLIILPAINAGGVRSGNRYLSDGRDLNRAFPGRAGGSIASFIAHEVFTKVLTGCDAIVDLHTASHQRANLPQIRADLSDTAIRELAIHFGLGIIIGESGPDDYQRDVDPDESSDFESPGAATNHDSDSGKPVTDADDQRVDRDLRLTKTGF